MVTLRELVAQPALRIGVLEGEAELDRVIEGVHTTDLPHPRRYLLQGEVVLTNGLWFPSVDADRWVADLALAGVAALGFGLGSPHPSVPGTVRSACAARNLPLLEIAEDLSFVAIADAAGVGGDQRSMFRRHLERARAMVQLMAEGREPAALLDVLHDATRLDASLVDAGGRVIAATGESPAPIQAKHAISLARAGRLPAEVATGLTAFGSSSGHRTHELVLLVGAAPLDIDDEARATINQVTDHLEMHGARRRSGREAARALALELIERSRTGRLTDEDHRLMLQALELDPDEPMLVLAGDHETDEMDAALETTAGAFVSAVDSGVTIALAQPCADGAVALVSTALVELGSSPTLGVGAPSLGADELERSIAEALVALRLARSRPPGERVVGLEEIGSVAHLLGEIDRDVLEGFRSTLLGPIERWDAERNAVLTDTLRAFFDHGCRWRATAAALHIHHNTLRYRLKRVEELTGRDLSLVADRLDLQIALLVPD